MSQGQGVPKIQCHLLFEEEEEGYNDGEVDDEEDEEELGGMAAFLLSEGSRLTSSVMVDCWALRTRPQFARDNKAS